MRSGERLHVHEVTELPTEGPRGRSLWNHLLSQAVKSGATVRLATPLNRLVFDDGEVIGAVIGRSPHECVVRAWSHVVLGTGDPGASLLLPPLPSSSDTRLCLVRRHASRFGQLAVLSERGAQVRLPRRQRARTRRLSHPSGAAAV
jgi:hypothetical protein